MNKKLKYVGNILLCALIGGFFGYFIPWLNENMTLNEVDFGFFVWMPSIFLFIWGLYFFLKGKAVIKKGIEDDVCYDKADKQLTLALGCVGVSLPIIMICMILAFMNLLYMESFTIVMHCIILVLLIMIQTYLQKQIIDAVKIIYPEKRGNIYDTNFEKDWLDSMDEAELSRMYQCGYRAFKKMNVIYAILVLVLFIFSAANIIDVFSSLLVGSLWMMQYIVYFVNLYKMEHGKNRC